MSKILEKTENVVHPASSSTRDAVESSIDLSKGDKFITWEKSACKDVTKIARWEDAKKHLPKIEQPSP
jgi:hypothetical protein